MSFELSLSIGAWFSFIGLILLTDSSHDKIKLHYIHIHIRIYFWAIPDLNWRTYFASRCCLMLPVSCFNISATFSARLCSRMLVNSIADCTILSIKSQCVDPSIFVERLDDRVTCVGWHWTSRLKLGPIRQYNSRPTVDLNIVLQYYSNVRWVWSVASNPSEFTFTSLICFVVW